MPMPLSADKPEKDEGLAPVEMLEPLRTPQERLAHLSKPVVMHGRPLPDPVFKRVLRKLIPGLVGFIGGVSGMTGAVAGGFELQNKLSKAVKVGAKASHWVHFAMSFVDFLTLPAAWLTSWAVFGERPKLTLSKMAKFGYAALILGLTLTSILFPPSALIIIGTVISMGFVVSALSLRNFFKAQTESRATFYAAKEEEEALLAALEAKRAAAENWLKTLAEDVAVDEALLAQLEEEIDVLENRLQITLDAKVQAKQTHESLDLKVATDKGVGLALSLVAVIGFGLLAGLGLPGVFVLATAAAIGAVYTLWRIIEGFASRKDTVNTQDSTLQAAQVEDTAEVAPQPSHGPEFVLEHDSTELMAQQLAASRKDAIRGLAHAHELLELQDTKIDWLDSAGRVEFFERMCTIISHEEYPASTEDILNFLRHDCIGFTPELAQAFVTHVRSKPGLLSENARDTLLRMLIEHPLPPRPVLKPLQALELPAASLEAGLTEHH
ncbi:coiled-coil protein [Legionella geestiana]|uniref:Coiled-coil protein n=1 Tax=Legionella geestiana TaxID=45065 RepID=A0A0W0TLJ2_9GAMM|nr:hypothetical protein [Legionella geestiana]KTC96480.1 coiled-coil protein [Legionella geestiana]QBS12522.1 hypothetical protein E4T54_07020 [Legionella geestiana]QDQ39765.1 hypothetical protein E3226_004845 [Legionella geestiana]STX55032.1 coiled-coil protein [Legionella geestiana]